MCCAKDWEQFSRVSFMLQRFMGDELRVLPAVAKLLNSLEYINMGNGEVSLSVYVESESFQKGPYGEYEIYCNFSRGWRGRCKQCTVLALHPFDHCGVRIRGALLPQPSDGLTRRLESFLETEMKVLPDVDEIFVLNLQSRLMHHLREQLTVEQFFAVDR